MIDGLPTAALLIDDNLRIVSLNAAGFHAFGGGVDVRGSDLRQHVTEGSRPQLDALGSFLRRPGSTTSVVDVEISKSVGSARASTLRLAASRSAEDKLTLLLCVDVTDLKSGTPRSADDSPARVVAVTRFAGGVAHDFNNLLQVILGRATLLRDTVTAGEPAEHLKELVTAAKRAQAVIQQMLSFGRQQKPSPIRVSLDELVQRLAEFATHDFPGSIEVVMEMQAEGVEITVDPSQVERVLGQVIANAKQALKDAGQLTIATGLVTRDDEMATHHPFVPPGIYGCVTVADTGPGIDPSVLPHIFEPFFTTKAPSRSSGMGLAEAYGIVKQAGGFILVDSEPARGTRVRLLFPPARAATVAGGREPTVLVVDDDDGVRALIVRVLRNDRYNVLEAESSAEAFLRAELHAGEIDVLVTDVSLADVGGPELATRMRAQYPALGVLLVTGNVSGADTAAATTLRKPFTNAALRSAVRSLLVDAAPVDDRAAS